MILKSICFEALLFTYIILSCAVIWVNCQKQCVINIKNDMSSSKSPLLLSVNNHLQTVYPDISDPRNIKLKPGEKIELFCPGTTKNKDSEVDEYGQFTLKNKRLNFDMHQIQCNNKGEWLFNGATVAFKDIGCVYYGTIFRKVSNNPCVNGERYEAGYDLGTYGFLRTYELCHDTTKANTLWSHGVVIPANSNFRATGGGSNTFKCSILFEKMCMSKIQPYNLNTAYDTFVKILSSSSAKKYVSRDIKDQMFLAKGHLIANADMFYISGQETTYYYANAVPMWQKINANPGNWFAVEEFVRKLSGNKKRNLDVWAGGIGVLKLENKEIFLYNEKTIKIPVPKILYKCVVDKEKKQAICFLVVNNPYLTKAVVENQSNGYITCPQINTCNNYIYNYDDVKRGYTYCCSLANFYNAHKKELGLEDFEHYKNYNIMQLS